MLNEMVLCESCFTLPAASHSPISYRIRRVVEYSAKAGTPPPRRRWSRSLRRAAAELAALCPHRRCILKAEPAAPAAARRVIR
jgi:hypothetical protein